MLKFTNHNFNVVFLSLVLFLGILFGYPNVAQADKAVQSVLFDPSSTAVDVANIYETTATTQKGCNFWCDEVQ